MAELPDSGLNKKIQDSAAIAKEADALDAELAELKNAYEQYFLGIERKPPAQEHRDLKKKIIKIKGAFVRQTALKFRINVLQQKFVSYERLWVRTLQEMEDGTYRRDLAKLRLKQEARKQKKPKDEKAKADDAGKSAAGSLEDAFSEDVEFEDVELDADSDVSLLPSPAPAAPAKPAAAKTTSGSFPAVMTAGPAPLGAPAKSPTGSASAVKPPSGASPAAKPVSGSFPAATAAGPRPPGAPAKSTTGSTPAVPAKSPSGTSSAVAPAKPASGSFRPATPARPPSGSSPAVPRASSAGELSDAKLKAVYDAYVTAKKRCQEDTSKLSFESVAANLRKQVPEVLKQSGAQAVEFKVLIKDGKAVLRAIPK
jgi:hypothetical protein